MSLGFEFTSDEKISSLGPPVPPPPVPDIKVTRYREVKKDALYGFSLLNYNELTDEDFKRGEIVRSSEIVKYMGTTKKNSSYEVMFQTLNEPRYDFIGILRDDGSFGTQTEEYNIYFLSNQTPTPTNDGVRGLVYDWSHKDSGAGFTNLMKAAKKCAELGYEGPGKFMAEARTKQFPSLT
jgi:hypothetical protein